MSFSDGEWEVEEEVVLMDAIEEGFEDPDEDNLRKAIEASKKEAEEEIKRKVIENINSIFGSDLSNLHKVTELQSTLNKKLSDLDSRLDVANSSAPTQLQIALNQGDEIKDGIDNLSERKLKLLDSAEKVVIEVENFSSYNSELLNDIGCVRGVTQYTVWLQLVEELNKELHTAMEGGTREEMVKCFSSIRDVDKELAGSQCHHLKKFVGDTMSYWLQLLQSKLVNELEGGLASLGWPFIQLEESRNLVDATKCMTITELQNIVKSLILVQDDRKSTEDEDLEKMQLTHPMKVLLKPLRKRFKFHFLGSKSTNNPAKPEWYTTQLVLWATLHRTFLDAHIQPVYDELELGVPARLEFGYGLVSLATEKLTLDLPLVQGDDVLLAHTIDEAIGFARDMAGQLQYSSAQPSALLPLTVGPVFSRWLNMERKFAFEKLDTVLCGEGAWESELGDGLIPRAAESFLAVLLSVTERYKFLTASQHRLQFLELQLQLLEDFRLRLVQLLRSEQEEPLQSNLCPILCTVHHLVQVLTNWGETPFFLQLEYQKCLLEELDMNGTVFDEAISNLEYLLSDMTSTITSSITYSVKARSRAYRKDVKWFSLPPSPNGVLPACCSLLQTIAFHFEAAGKMLPGNIFTKVWHSVAEEVGKFICEEVILANRFCMGGAKQLETDIKLGLLPIFGEFTSCPQAHFPVLVDCVKLLNVSAGTLILSMETLEDTASPTAASSTLKELGLTRLTVVQAVAVIQTRVDLEM
eukprot:GFUD01026040.1.p1 GENE.GFUD01026040.1~~GFUD01026040.1.p1  ORF type:complete len:752 (+),score=245.95 GFUD01026040.1:32-2287(+)